MTCLGPALPVIHRENTDLMNVLLQCLLVDSEAPRLCLCCFLNPPLLILGWGKAGFLIVGTEVSLLVCHSARLARHQPHLNVVPTTFRCVGSVEAAGAKFRVTFKSCHLFVRARFMFSKLSWLVEIISGAVWKAGWFNHKRNGCSGVCTILHLVPPPQGVSDHKQ